METDMLPPYRCLHCRENFATFHAVFNHIQNKHDIVAVFRRDYVNKKIIENEIESMVEKFSGHMQSVMNVEQFLYECEQADGRKKT